jgi:UDP-N-acetylglucosamine--N-acetylmuramyl-(pentapeptide) pyrophosphoryl-undecaprenol N-acetylglucosamine transferase
VLLVGGGTGGHVSPLLAVAEALLEVHPGVRFLFVGGRRGLEADLVAKAGLPFYRLPLASLRDPDSKVALITNNLAIPLAFATALVRLARYRPSVCLTSGGAIAYPVILAARVLRVPVYLWEGNVLPGRANRALARWAQRIGATFPGTERHLPAAKTVLAGNPIRRSLLRWTREAGRERLAIAPDEIVILVTGGSQGSERVNDAFSGALGRLLRMATVIHHTGPAYLARIEAKKRVLPDDVRERYRPYGFLNEEMGAALASADLIVGRAGSSSIAEPLAFGVPLVLIPFGASMGGHQAANARSVVELGAAALITESELSSDRLAAVVMGLLNDPSRLARMREAAKRAGRPDAAIEVARDLLRLGGCA